jgi:3-methyladenine DNA glycosylase/8-oxoguanine DNA glycosylase
VIDLRVDVAPRWPLRLPRRGGPDGLTQVRGGVVTRLLHIDGEPVLVRAAQHADGRIRFGAEAASEEAGLEGITRMRFALGVDDDLAEFHARFRRDPLIGAAVRARPWLRVRRRPEPFEALAWAITEQLIEYVRAAAIQRRIVRALGRRCPRTGLRDAPTPAALAAVSPARLESWDLSAGRALTLRRASREVAAGRVALRGRAGEEERGRRRLASLPGIGRWTVETLALQGQGHLDQLPAGDLGYLKLVGRLTRSDPRSRATEDDVRDFFAPYAPWAGLAAAYAFLAAPGRAPAAGAPAVG